MRLIKQTVVVAILLLLAPINGLADSPANDNAIAPKAAAVDKKAEADAKARGLNVVVTASRGSEQDSIEVPQAIDSVSRNDLDAQPYKDIQAAIDDLPNVGLAPSEGNPNYWEQGFNIRGLGAQRVLTLTDGIRVAGQGVGYGGGNLSLYDTFGTERIEVLRGPGSVLYGTDAFGGVVNVITRNPKEREEQGANSGLLYGFDGANNQNRAGAYVDFGDKAYGTVLGGTFTDAGQPNLPDGESAHQGSYRQWSFWGKSDFKFTDKTKLRFLGNWNRNYDILVDDETIALPIAVNGPPGSLQMISSPQYFTLPYYSRSLLGTELTSEDLSPTVEFLKTGVYWQALRRDFHRETAFYPTFSPGFAGPPTFIDPSASVNQSVVDTRDRVNSVEWQSQSRLNLADNNKLTIGLDVGHDASRLPESETDQIVAQAGIGAVQMLPTSTTRLRANASQNRVGLYAQDELVSDRFSFLPGMRFDYFDVNDDVTSTSDSLAGLSGSLGTVYHLADQQSIYANVSTGFRAPDLGERYQDGIFNLGVPSRLIGNPSLDAERAVSGEIGSKLHDGRFHYDIASFVTHVNRFIGRKGVGLVDGFATEQYDNVGGVSMYGGEAQTTVDITDQLGLYGSVGRTWTYDSEKLDVPAMSFSYGVRYRQPINSESLKSITTGLNLRTSMESHQDTVTPGRNPFPSNNAFTTVGFELNGELGKVFGAKASIVSGIRNIFNQNYYEPFFSVHQPGRNAYVALQTEF
jgi:hemoglobin/transferrin/lactoferrin receptor protein